MTSVLPRALGRSRSLAVLTPAATAGRARSDATPSVRSLADVAPGAHARVVEVTGPTARRLTELGVRHSVEVRVLARAAGGGLTVAVGTSRFALDRSVLRSITVEPGGGRA